MIDNTMFQKAGDEPAFQTREEAIASGGDVRLHVKGGGIYRKIGIAKYAGDKCAAELDGEMMSIYEHLWPHKHTFFVRPDSEFEEIVSSDKRTTDHERFERFS